MEAVVIGNVAEGTSYAEVMKRVMNGVQLQDLGVEILKARRIKAGAFLLEVPNKEEATKLSDSLLNVLGDMVQVTRPSRRTPVLILNIPDWLEDEQVLKDITSADEALTTEKFIIRNNSGGGRVASFSTSMEIAARLIPTTFCTYRLESLQSKTTRKTNPRLFSMR